MSLRARLLLASLLVAGVAIGVVGLVTQRTLDVQMAAVHALVPPGCPDLAPAVADLQRHWELRGGWQGVDAVLRRHQPSGLDLVLTDGAGAFAGTTSRTMRGRTLSVGGGGELKLRPLPGGTQGPSMIIRGAPSLPIRSGGRQVGTLFATVLPDPDQMMERARLRRQISAGLVWALALGGALAVGLILTLGRAVLRPVRELTAAAGRMARGDLSVRVVTGAGDEIGQLARSFNAMADALARQETLRRDLVGDVAHELRTPLANLRCQLEAIEDGLARPDAATIRSLREDTLLLARLVDDLQQLSLAEAGALRLDLEPLAPAELVERALAAVRSAAVGAGVTLEPSAPADLPPVHADRERVAQVLGNLLTNAVQHTPAGGRVVVAARSVAEGVEFTVRDTGTGIPAGHLPLVFERFHRVDPSRARATGGAGLGLAIVRRLVEAHGGTVRVESGEGEGSTFAFTLPLAPTA
jgi:signal transduction histidine kinase